MSAPCAASQLRDARLAETLERQTQPAPDDRIFASPWQRSGLSPTVGSRFGHGAVSGSKGKDAEPVVQWFLMERFDHMLF